MRTAIVAATAAITALAVVPATAAPHASAPARPGVARTAPAAMPVPALGYVTGRSYPYGTAVPGFPTHVSGYRRTTARQTTVRVFQGSGWTSVPGMPRPSANDCSSARWFVRWRSGNPDVAIRAGGDALGTGPGPMTATGSGGAGYIAGSSCNYPVLAFGKALNGNGSTLADVLVQWQAWQRR